VVLLSFYKPHGQLEFNFMLVLALALNINAVMFLLSFAVFIFTIKTDIVQIDYLEQYIDIEETTKNML
jgi:hypothetical protein